LSIAPDLERVRALATANAHHDGGFVGFRETDRAVLEENRIAVFRAVLADDRAAESLTMMSRSVMPSVDSRRW
jgi:hypothetical protein